MSKRRIRKCNHLCDEFHTLPTYRHADLCTYEGKGPGDRVIFVYPNSECRYGLLEQKAEYSQTSPSRTGIDLSKIDRPRRVKLTPEQLMGEDYPKTQ